MKTLDHFVITFDIDWAPDFVIDSVASMLRLRGIRATWFVTHQCSALDRLRKEEGLFELGLHPNFLAGSTQGDTPEKVLAHLQSIVPEAISLRTHALVQSGPLLQMVMRAGLKVDVSLFLPSMSNIQPLEFRIDGRTLLRIPYFWSDDYEMEKAMPCWHLLPLLKVKGLKVMNFHPLLVFLNGSDIKPYQAIKQKVPILDALTAKTAEDFFQPGDGTQTFFHELIDHVTTVGESLRIQDIFDIWTSRGGIEL